MVEIGGYKTPISGFLNSEQKSIVIDPRIEPLRTDKSEHLAIGFEDWVGEVLCPYGVLILGIELHMYESGWEKLYRLINGSEITVIEVPVEHCHSVDQFKRIREKVNKKAVMSILMDLSGNDFGDLSGSAPPKTLRQINVLK